MPNLEGRTAIVTGGASGIGRATALALMRAGARVIVADRQEFAAGHDTGLAGDELISLRCDVTTETDVIDVCRIAAERFGRLNVLVNAAGVSSPPISLEDTVVKDWERLLAINLTGSFLFIKHTMPLMQESPGASIVNVASVGGIRPSAGAAFAYAASKGGIIALTQRLVHDLSPHGVRINAIAPGPVRTALTDAAGPSWRLRRGNAVPLGRVAEPDEIADVALFLASDMARYVTGHTLVADGGLTAVSRDPEVHSAEAAFPVRGSDDT